MSFLWLYPFFLSNQKVTYKTKRPMYDLRTIAEVEGAGVKAGKHAEWREQIIVPPLPQSALAGCSLIDIDYFIQVRTCVVQFSFDFQTSNECTYRF